MSRPPSSRPSYWQGWLLLLAHSGSALCELGCRLPFENTVCGRAQVTRLLTAPTGEPGVDTAVLEPVVSLDGLRLREKENEGDAHQHRHHPRTSPRDVQIELGTWISRGDVLLARDEAPALGWVVFLDLRCQGYDSVWETASAPSGGYVFFSMCSGLSFYEKFCLPGLLSWLDVYDSSGAFFVLFSDIDTFVHV